MAGNTIFNLLRMGDVDTDANDRPIDDPPRLERVTVVDNPFDDIVPRNLAAKKQARRPRRRRRGSGRRSGRR